MPGNSTYQKTKPDWGFRVEMWMIHELGLRGVERDVYAVVYAFTFDGNPKQIEMSFLAEFVGATDRRVQQVIRDLVAKRLIEYATVRTPRGERVELRAIVPNGVGVKKIHPRSDGGEKISEPGVKKFQGGGEKISPPINIEKQDINQITKHTHTSSEQDVAAYTPPAAVEEEVAPDGARVRVQDEFAKFAKSFPKPAKPAVKKRAAIEWARLAANGWTAEQIADRLGAYIDAKRDEGIETRYWHNLADFLATDVESDVYIAADSDRWGECTVEIAVGRSASPAAVPDEAECPACGTMGRIESGTGMYWCRTCNGSFSPQCLSKAV